MTKTAPLLSDALKNSRFLKAARREPTEVPPVWIMRQAGRYMPEYMDVRKKVTFLELCQTPELAAKVTLDAQRILNVDAAILFADLLPILQPMGLHLEYAAGEGPVIHNPLRDARDLERFHELEDVSSQHFVLEAIRLIRRDLPADIPLLGFAGAPFTLASYALEGGGSKNFTHTKRFMYSDPGAWRTLMERLTRTLIRYLNAQIDAGCQAVQIFDSWVGCLTPADYREFVLPYSKAVIEGITPGVPVIHFATGNSSLIPLMKEAGGSIFGLDWRVDLKSTWDLLGPNFAVQGNLDPVTLLAPWGVVKERTANLLNSVTGRPGHIFNLGHGVLPETDPNQVKSLVQLVHDFGASR